MNFIVMTEEKAYETIESLTNKLREETDTSVIFQGDHPEYGALQIVIPSTGQSIVFGHSFEAKPLAIQ